MIARNEVSPKSHRTSSSRESKDKSKERSEVALSDTDKFFQNAAMIFQIGKTFESEENNHVKDLLPPAELSSSLRHRNFTQEVNYVSIAAGNEKNDIEAIGETAACVQMNRETIKANQNQSSIQKLIKNLLFRVQNLFSFRDQLSGLVKYLKLIFIFCGIPLLGTAALLYYVFDNPMTTKAGGSVSWWLILTFRWIVSLSLAKGTEYILLDCLALRSAYVLKFFGPVVTLIIAQSKGWPFQLLTWCIFNFGMLYGERRFVLHWLYYQDYIEMFSDKNEAAEFLSTKLYLSVLTASSVLGIFAALKRTAVSLYLGRRTCEFYGPQLEKIMNKLVLVSSVAQLAKEIERELIKTPDVGGDEKVIETFASPFYVGEALVFHPKRAKSEAGSQPGESDEDSATSQGEMDDTDTILSPKDDNFEGRTHTSKTSVADDALHAERTRKILASKRGKMMRQLDTWEEPVNMMDAKGREKVSIEEILQFNEAMAQINVNYPFSRAFGIASDRKSCADSAEEVFKRLLLRTPNEKSLPFETISILGLDEYGELDEVKTKKLVKVFRPSGDGKLNLLEFIRSCDEVYRRFRTFRAAVANSSVVNNAYERIIDGIFYFLMAIMVLLIFQVDVWTLLVSVSSLVVSFAFAFGAAVSKFMEGVLLVTVRKPFDVGDRIHISSPDCDTAPEGSRTWFVENITLFATTVRFASTNEVATIANGNLANTRIINAARSPRMFCFIRMKFGIDVPLEKVQFFRQTLESFIKARPREWIALCAFRVTQIEADQGYVEYIIVLQHRERWQNLGEMLCAKAEVASYCLEVSKKLNMRYVAPALPVQLGFNEDSPLPMSMPMPIQTASSERPACHRRADTMENPSAAVQVLQEIFAPKKKEGRRHTKI